MGAMCNNSFIINITTEGHSLSKEDIKKMLKKKFGRNVILSVEEYVPPPPKMKVYPERKTKARDWAIVIKSDKSSKKKKEKVYCSDCKYYKHSWMLGYDCVAKLPKYEDYYDERRYVPVNPSIKNKNNNCKDFVRKQDDKA